MTDEEIERWKKRIDEMSHVACARLWRFATTGHPIFDSTLPLFEYYRAHFEKLGGMTPEVSKLIGWVN